MILRKYLKICFYRSIRFLKNPAWVLSNVKVAAGSRVRVSVLLKNCSVGRYCYLADRVIVTNAVLGNFVSIGPNVTIGGAEHETSGMSTSLEICAARATGKTEIQSDVWIGAGAVVRAGVKIGVGAVVGANSVVTRDVEPFSVVVGVPAKHLRFRVEEHARARLLESKWWLKTIKELKHHGL